MLKKLLVVSLFLLPSFTFASSSLSSFRSPDTVCSVSSRTITVTNALNNVNSSVLIVPAWNNSGSQIISVTYDGVPLTRTEQIDFFSDKNSLWYLYSPHAGTHSLVVTANSAAFCIGFGYMFFDGIDITYSPFVTGSSTALNSNVMAWTTLTPPSGLNTNFIAFTSIQGRNADGLLTGNSVTKTVGTYDPYSGLTNVYSSDFVSSVSLQANWAIAQGNIQQTTTVFKLAGAGNNSTSTPYSATTTVYVPASMYSSKFISDPPIAGASTTYNFISPQANVTSSKDAGVLFVVNKIDATSTAKWGGVQMQLIATTTTNLTNYILSMYYLVDPLSSSTIQVTGHIGTGNNASIRYISASVWDNANITDTFNQYAVVPNILKAFINLNSSVQGVTATAVSGFYTQSGIVGFSPNASTVLQATSSASSGDFSFVSRVCTYSYDECNVGFTKIYSVFDTQNGIILGMNLYATSSISLTNSPTVNLGLTGYGTEANFTSCVTSSSGIIDGFTCIAQNMFFWTLGLFVPTASDMGDIRDALYKVTTASTSLTTSLIFIPVEVALWSSPSSIPNYNTFTLSVPISQNRWLTYNISGSQSSFVTRIDSALYNIFIWIFGVFTVLWIGNQKYYM